jgi:hypothetical protein
VLWYIEHRDGGDIWDDLQPTLREFVRRDIAALDSPNGGTAGTVATAATLVPAGKSDTVSDLVPGAGLDRVS